MNQLLYKRAKWDAGSVRCCPWMTQFEYTGYYDGSDRQTDRQTDALCLPI